MAAKRIQQRPDSTANVFEVVDDRGESVPIDLDEEHEHYGSVSAVRRSVVITPTPW